MVEKVDDGTTFIRRILMVGENRKEVRGHQNYNKHSALVRRIGIGPMVE
jgi:hypothetical protein